jgi:hypothetical protein
MDVCYHNRCALESDSVSQELHLWIDLIFGYRCSSLGFVPIFDRPHPARGLRAPARRSGFSAQFSDRFVFADVFAIHRRGFKIATVNADWQFGILEVREGDWTQHSRLHVQGAPRFCRIGDSVFFVNQSVQLLNRGHFRLLHAFTPVLAVDGLWVVVMRKDSRIGIYKWPDLNRPFRCLNYFREAAVCCCVSHTLHTFVFATECGGLVVGPLEKGHSTITAAVQSGIITGVWLTPTWGFIIALHQVGRTQPDWAMSIFTINGTLIRAVGLAEKPTAVTVWASAHDFDYIAVASRSGVLVSEAYHLNFQKPLMALKTETLVLALAFDSGARALIVVFANGSVVSEPCDFL